MKITNNTYMKTLFYILIGLATLSFISACGSSDSMESKKAQLEKLKAQQLELTAQISTLEAELAASGADTGQAVNANAKYVQVTTVEKTLFEHAVDVQGRVDANENVTILPRAQGPITKIYLRTGQQVKAGQIIAEINNDMVKSQINDLNTNLELVNQIYQKQKSLWEQKVGTEVQYLQAKTNKESLEAKLAQAKELLDMHYYKSPINGVVDDMPLKVGQMVSAAAPLTSGVRVVNLSSLKVKADLSESYAASVSEGDAVNLFFPDIDKRIQSKLSYAEKQINPMTRTFGVEIGLPTDAAYRSNMIAQVSIIDYTNKDVVVVPINTIQNLDEKKVVYIAVKEGANTVAKKVEVETGKMYNGKVEVLKGLNPGDQLITTGFQDMNEGVAIRY